MMELYNHVSYQLSRTVIESYSSSFSLSSRLFPKELRKHVMAVYGLVRIADEIVDTYAGDDKRDRLDTLEAETTLAMRTGYSTNPIVHAFGLTARQFAIEQELVEAFFTSMRLDTAPQTYDRALYATYIYGSAEVIGLMCLRLFVDAATYDTLRLGAQALGSAYQKINFLRDIHDDAVTLKRWYFPEGSYDTFDEAAKQHIIKEIRQELATGTAAARRLPSNAQSAVELSIDYFGRLLERIAQTPASHLKTTRVRIPNSEKLGMLLRQQLRRVGRHA